MGSDSLLIREIQRRDPESGARNYNSRGELGFLRGMEREWGKVLY